jgi:hypothetical protein
VGGGHEERRGMKRAFLLAVGMESMVRAGGLGGFLRDRSEQPQQNAYQQAYRAGRQSP